MSLRYHILKLNIATFLSIWKNPIQISTTGRIYEILILKKIDFFHYSFKTIKKLLWHKYLKTSYKYSLHNMFQIINTNM